MKLICRVDCTKEYGKGEYFEIGQTRIVKSDLGSYREASEGAQSRFGYKFRLEDLSKPHLMEIKYPDDRNRYMCINNGSTYDLTTGVVCGYRNKNSMKMLTHKNYFFPRFKEEAIVFSSWGDGEPAAVSEFSVYELDCLPEFGVDFGEGKRDFGIQYEDPCNVGSAEGTKDYFSWSKRIIEYMMFTGQNKLIYPVCWYHGATVPTKSDRSSALCSYCADNRKAYSRSTYYPNDWLDSVLSDFDEKGLSFVGSMTLLRLRDLMLGMNGDIDSIRNGAETYNNVLFDGTVQSSVNDWTGEYDAEVFGSIPEFVKKYDRKPLGLNERRTSEHVLPIFNPLHPTVRNSVKSFIRELGESYAHYPSFKGLAVNFWHGTILWYSSLKAGYDDYSIGLFEAENSIDLGISNNDPERFTKRYDYIKENLLDKFVSWRCQKIKEFITELRDVLVDIRSDLTLTLTVWNETSASSYLGGINANSQFLTRKSNYEVYRDGGLDLKLFAEEKNIEVAVEHNHQRDRSGWGTEGCNTPLENSQMFCDFAFLDFETRDAVHTSQAPTSFIFNCWCEAWGEYETLESDPNDPEIEKIMALPDFKAKHILMGNAEYIDDMPPNRKYFYDSQLRITSAFPTDTYFSEWFANELATQDSLSITAGGLYLDKAHAEIQQKFISEYRKLPRRKFNSVENAVDPVTVRYLYCEDENVTYVYAVNREPYSIDVCVETDLGKSEFTLSEFGLKTLVFEGETVSLSVEVSVSDEIKKDYVDRYARILPKLTDSINKGTAAKGTEKMLGDMDESLAKGQFAFVRHAMSSYPILKALQ